MKFSALAGNGMQRIFSDAAAVLFFLKEEKEKNGKQRKQGGQLANTHKDNNEIPLRAKEVLPGMVGCHKKVISYFLRNGVASVTPFPVSAVLPQE